MSFLAARSHIRTDASARRGQISAILFDIPSDQLMVTDATVSQANALLLKTAMPRPRGLQAMNATVGCAGACFNLEVLSGQPTCGVETRSLGRRGAKLRSLVAKMRPPALPSADRSLFSRHECLATMVIDAPLFMVVMVEGSLLPQVFVPKTRPSTVLREDNPDWV